jgi:hypothetical protein
MKHIKDLTEKDCIHCATQEEFNAICELIRHTPKFQFDRYGNSLHFNSGEPQFYPLEWAKSLFFTIHPASDFLTPQVSVLTEIGDTKVIKNGGDVIVMTGNVVITLTPPVLKHIQELLNQQQ